MSDSRKATSPGCGVPSDEGDITIGDPVVTAWALMAVGEMIGMRWILWGDTREVPAEVFHEAMAVVARVLGVEAAPGDDDG